MKLPEVCLFALLVVGPTFGRAFEWKPCDDVTTTAQTIQNVTLSPDPVPVGSTAKFMIHGVSNKEVESGTIELTVHYLGAKVYSKTTDLCEQNDCPIEKGKFVSRFEEKFPIYTPPGDYRVTILSKDDKGEPLACLNVMFKVKWHIMGFPKKAGKSVTAAQSILEVVQA